VAHDDEVTSDHVRPAVDTAPAQPGPPPPAGLPPSPDGGPRPRARWLWALAGIASAAAGLGVAEILAALIGPTSAPVVAVSQTFIDHTPAWLKDFAIATFGTHDKQALLTGAGAVLLVLAATAGVLARRRPGPAIWLVVALAAAGSYAASTRPDATILAPVPSVAGAVLTAVVLSSIRNTALRRGQTPRSPDDARRALLAASGIAVAGGAVAGGVGRLLSTAARGVETSREEVTLPRPVSPEPPLPGGVEVGVKGVVPFRVPAEDFYRIDTATVVPRLRAQDWKLRIHGMVTREVTLDFAGLLAGGLVQRDVTLCCVSNDVGGDLIGNATWLGLPIAPLLRQAGPTADADMVLSTSDDGWTASTPLSVLTDGRDALLAVGMNGAPLPIEHGFPVRMVVPGLYGYVSATKWVVELEVTRFDLKQGYWTPRGWSERGPIKTESRIDVPQDGDRVRAGRVAVAGIAWAQHRGIKGVEVRVDDGPWQAAELGAEASVDTWRQWVFRWDAAPGQHRLAVRAVDGTSAVQTGDEAPPAPDGATGWHTITVDVT
jgi:DMSO/TMAO reductase YedYZ molybdopterin-dependent catalytic subunit